MTQKRSLLKRALVGVYLLCALGYFAFNSHRITVEPKYKTTHQLQSLALVMESLLFPFYLTYYHYFYDFKGR